MQSNMEQSDLDTDQTIPAAHLLRSNSPFELYQQMPEIARFTQHRPTEQEDALAYMERLRNSRTPEDALTYVAFAPEPAPAIRWGMACLQRTHPNLSAEDAQLATSILQWLETPSDEHRWATLQHALFASHRTPWVHLGLAVGWSGGSMAPNDPLIVPYWRTPRAINVAVLSSIAALGLPNRAMHISQALDLTTQFFRIH
jgi:hypothetical protein